MGRLTGIDTVLLLDLDGTLYEGSQVVPDAPRGGAVAARPGPHGAVHHQHRLDPPGRPRRPPGPARPPGHRGRAGGPDRGRRPAGRVHRRGAGAGRGHRGPPPAAGQLPDRAGPGERATHVLVADPGHGATYDDLDAAFRALRSEAQLVTTQVNRIARRDDGEHLDTGGWVRLLEYATGQTARVLGKPSPEFLTAPLNALGRGAQARW